MLTAYKYIFYHLLWWSNKRDVSPEWTAFLTVGMAVWMNLMTLWGLLELLTRQNLFRELPNLAIASLAFLTLIPQYFMVLHGRRYEKIARQYEHESSKERQVGNLLAALYVGISFLLWIGGAVALSRLSH
jgi:hypothetical protein